MSAGDLPAIIGAVAVLVTGVFGGLAQLDARRRRRDADSAEDYANLQRWYPRAMRAFTLLSGLVGRLGGVVPAEAEELIAFPPPKPKHASVSDDEG